jgi:hypothetical protein
MFYEYVGFQGDLSWDSRVTESLTTVIEQSHVGTKKSFLVTDSPHGDANQNGIVDGAEDISKRLVALSEYLLVSHPRVFWQYTVDDLYMTTTWFPEWTLPLGAAVIPTLAAYGDLEWTPGSNTLLYRAFANGMVFYNHDSISHSVTLPTAMRKVSITPGLDPSLGGTSIYLLKQPELSYTIAPQDALIVLKNQPLSRLSGAALRDATLR